jgi:plastocyanin
VAALLTGLGLAVLPAEAADQSVSVSSDVFTPSSVTVSVGDTVTWTNTGGRHNVHFEDESFVMPDPASTSSWTRERTFNTAGSFAYYCDVHRDEGMTGTVTVIAASTAPPGGSPPPPGGGPAPAPGPDRTKPAVTGFTIKRRRFRVTKAKRPFSFRLSEAASVRLVISRKVRKRYRVRGTLTRRDLAAGKHTIAFKGRLAGKKLAPGSYRASITATDTTGNRSATRRVAFRVLGG